MAIVDKPRKTLVKRNRNKNKGQKPVPPMEYTPAKPPPQDMTGTNEKGRLPPSIADAAAGPPTESADVYTLKPGEKLEPLAVFDDEWRGQLPESIIPNNLPDSVRAYYSPRTVPRTKSGMPIPLRRMIGDVVEAEMWLGCLTIENWHVLEVYVYQEWPVERVPEGEFKYLVKLSEPFSLSWFLRTYKSGDYNLSFNDSTINGKARTVVRFSLKLRNSQFPPRINLELLVLDHKDNRPLVNQLIREGKLNTQGEVVDVATPADTAGAQNAATIDKLTVALLDIAKEKGKSDGGEHTGKMFASMIEMMAKAGERSTQMAIDQAKANDPMGMVGVLTKLMELMRPAQVVAATGPDPMVTFLMDEVRELRRQNAVQHEVTMKMIADNANKTQQQSSPLETIKTVLGMRDTLLGGMGGGDNTPKNWKEMAVSAAADNLPGLFDMGTAAFEALKAKWAGGGGGVAVAANPQVQRRQVSQVTGAQTQPAGAGTTTNQPQTQQESNTVGIPQALIDQCQSRGLDPVRITALHKVLDSYGGYLLKAIDQDSGGDEFANSVRTLAGQSNYDNLRQYTPTEALFAVLTYGPTSERFQAPPAQERLAQFWDDFVECGGYVFADEDPGNDPPPPSPSIEVTWPAKVDASTKPPTKRGGKSKGNA